MERNLLSLSICLIVCFITNNGFSQDTEQKSISKKADSYLSSLVPFGFNGVVLISKNEEIILNKGYGLAKHKDNIPNDPEIAYSLGSIVKPFTSSLIMKMVQNGEIKLTDRLEKFMHNIPEDKRSITIHHLLSHSSGLPGSIGPDTAYISREHYLKQAMNAQLAFEPGSRYLYSNTAYTLLAMIIENISGNEYEQYLNKMVFQPAGMKSTGYKIPNWNRQKVANNYSEGHDNGSFLDREHYPTWHLTGNGGMLSTTEDMFRFYLFLKGDQFLNSKTKELMFTPVFMEDAYGWVNIDNGEIIQHNGGGLDGNGALFRWFPKDDICMIIFTNSTFQNRPGFLFIQRPLEQLVFGDEVSMPPLIDSHEEVDLSNLEGVINTSNGAIMELRTQLNTLNVYPKNQMAVNMLFNGNGIIDWTEWNEKIRFIISKAVEDQDYSQLGEITKSPDKLKDELINEIEMEGYQNPSCSVLFTIQIDPEVHLTEVAIADHESTDWVMLFHLYFREDQFLGLGIDFGSKDLPEVSFVPQNRSHFEGYSFRFEKDLFMDITYDEQKNPEKISFNGNPAVSLIKMTE